MQSDKINWHTLTKYDFFGIIKKVLNGKAENIMEREKLNKISTMLSSSQENFMTSFRQNLMLYLSTPDMTIKELAEMADIPLSTLNSILYGNSKDCKLSTAISLAKALNVSVDEIVGARTIHEDIREHMAIIRNLPKASVHFIKWSIKHQAMIHDSNPKGKRILSVMEPVCNQNGNIKMTNVYRHIDIPDVDNEIYGKIFLGMKIPCEHYMPIYSPYDVLLIANDRLPLSSEHVLVVIRDCVYIVKRKVEQGVGKLYGIRDDNYIIDESDADEIVGYVAGIYTLND